MKVKIIELFKKYEGAVDRSNYPEMAICEDNYNELAEDIVKLFATPDVVGRGEQLCQHDRSVTNRICDDCGSVITYVPDDKLLAALLPTSDDKQSF